MLQDVTTHQLIADILVVSRIEISMYIVDFQFHAQEFLDHFPSMCGLSASFASELDLHLTFLSHWPQ